MNPEIEKVIEEFKKEENFITKAKLLRFLTVDKDMRIKDLSRYLGMKESYICHILRLNKLSDMIVDGYYSRLISISHLFIISRLHNEKDIMDAYEKVLSNNMTVAETEELVREMLYQIKSSGSHIQKEEIQTSAKQIEELFPGTHLKIIQTRIKSRCILEIKGGLEQTSQILRLLLKKLEST
ncbi:MAG: hypothetical protein WC489_04680 [Patescibacteria group bacterium]